MACSEADRKTVWAPGKAHGMLRNWTEMIHDSLGHRHDKERKFDEAIEHTVSLTNSYSLGDYVANFVGLDGCSKSLTGWENLTSPIGGCLLLNLF